MPCKGRLCHSVRVITCAGLKTGSAGLEAVCVPLATAVDELVARSCRFIVPKDGEVASAGASQLWQTAHIWDKEQSVK